MTINENNFKPGEAILHICWEIYIKHTESKAYLWYFLLHNIVLSVITEFWLCTF